MIRPPVPLQTDLPLSCSHVLLLIMLTIEVQISHGRVTPVGSQPLPENGRGFLTVLSTASEGTRAEISIGTEADGLPVIRTQGGVITSEMVREIEGLAG